MYYESLINPETINGPNNNNDLVASTLVEWVKRQSDKPMSVPALHSDMEFNTMRCDFIRFTVPYINTP